MDNNIIKSHLQESNQILNEFINAPHSLGLIEEAGKIMLESLQNGGKIISCGNGGSMCDAMHFAEELTGKFRNNRNSIPAVAISDPSHITCVANDYGFDFVFSRFIESIGNKNDTLLVISTSGNSMNCIKAVEAAIQKGLKVVALTGKEGGKLASLAHVEIRAPKSNYADRAQEIHIKVIHCLIAFIEQGFKQ
ncbi:MAG: D-sedoheptulose 7-phosphate isomerase [Bacteroidetes bacterium]|nr:D-sedoheptulose 7-phosphate isomerase [Bacteroidota bacterium]MBV6460843.1 Phosphoheptose isomerase [Flavobacteriales bacterium]WKZ75843.1 MAG: D-sedoheptulose 7-phosphate isomerase [Vicingaceae bacterium]MCL4816611.1 D-sedoheptulose 7-phosphate isomerase [Flavobacteriales bacterium]NOG95656.1 D-sedoheptulose 7-phosphate isomerase [Bacteroidota bacterium]